jgi:hypothetical protein
VGGNVDFADAIVNKKSTHFKRIEALIEDVATRFRKI